MIMYVCVHAQAQQRLDKQTHQLLLQQWVTLVLDPQTALKVVRLRVCKQESTEKSQNQVGWSHKRGKASRT